MIPVVEIPTTKYLCNNKKNKIAGKLATNAEAIKIPKLLDNPIETKVAIPIVIVLVSSELQTINGQKNSFQLLTNVKIATVAIAGMDNGK